MNTYFLGWRWPYRFLAVQLSQHCCWPQAKAIYVRGRISPSPQRQRLARVSAVLMTTLHLLRFIVSRAVGVWGWTRLHLDWGSIARRNTCTIQLQVDFASTWYIYIYIYIYIYTHTHTHTLYIWHEPQMQIWASMKLVFVRNKMWGTRCQSRPVMGLIQRNRTYTFH